MDIAEVLPAIRKRQQSDGAFSVGAGGGPRPDATAWAVLAMRASGEGESAAAVEAARKRLVQDQLPDGRVSVTPQHPASCWPTPLALLAWHGWPAGQQPAQRALDFLKGERVMVVESERQVNTIDSSLNGWSWVAGTFSWVEPTALAVLAYDCYQQTPDRVQQGVKLLLDRQLPKGGWNYGNTVVYGAELLPSEEYIGVALSALAGRCEEAQIRKSIELLEGRLPQIRTPLALAWGILGLSAWGRRPAAADQWIAECLARQERLGAFDTPPLALLALAARCANGLRALFPLSTP